MLGQVKSTLARFGNVRSCVMPYQVRSC